MSNMYNYLEHKTKYIEEQYGGAKSINKSIDSTNNNDDYKVIKELGMGMMGTVYLAEDDQNNKYAMKTEKILKKHSIKSLKYDIWRDIEFSNTMSKKYPEHFMKVYDNWIDKKCKHVQDWDKIGLKLDAFDKMEQKYYKSLFDSSYCSVKVYSLVDCTLKDIIDKISDEQYYDIFIQCLYIMHLCETNGYLHRDWKMDNIGLVKTDNEFINILGKKVKTRGYNVVLLDYGAVIHKKYILSSYEKKLYSNNMTDLFFMFDRYAHNMIFNFRDFEKKYGTSTFENITIDDVMVKKIQKYLPKYDKNNKVLEQYVYKIIYHEHFERKIMNDENIVIVKPKLFLPMKAIEYIIKNIYDVEKCITYLINHNKN